MSAPAIFRKTLSGLVPANDRAAEMVGKVKAGALVQAVVKQPRSLPWLARYWVLCAKIAENLPTSKGNHLTAEQIHFLLKLECGCATPIKRKNGEVIFIPDSIAFQKMNHDEWSAYWDRVCDFVAADLLPGLSRADLEAEVGELIGLPPATSPTQPHIPTPAPR